MVSDLDNNPDLQNDLSATVHKPEIDLFWLYARAATSHDPDELRDLACCDCDPIRRRVACNPASPPDVLEWLAVDWHPAVRAAVAENPVTGEALLEKLIQDSEQEVRLAVAKELSLRALSTFSLLETLAQDEDVEVAEKARQALAPAGSKNVLAHPAMSAAERVSKSA